MDAARARKLADRIQQIVAEMLERRIKDPRLGFVTVTDARITNDLREATVYYTVYGSPEEQAGTAAALESARGVIRSAVGRQLGVRHTPTLAFEVDEVIDNARHIEDLLSQARARDEQVARAAEGAMPAGEPNPYRDAGEAADQETADQETADEQTAGDATTGQGRAVQDTTGEEMTEKAGNEDEDAGYSAP